MTEDLAINRDEWDLPSNLRESFSMPENIIYLNGNSLGPMQFRVKQRLQEVVDIEWGEDLITSWNKHGWIDLPDRVGEKIAPIIGASSGQVVCCDSISINLFKLLASAIQLRPNRTKGCGYKYLNGGPGAPSFLYVNRRLHGQFIQPLQGWMGHEKPFQFEQEFVPSAGIRQFVSGTPQILSLAALDSALEVFQNLHISSLQKKASALSEHFLELILKEPDLDEFQLISPTDLLKRGAQLSFSHPSAYAISRAWIEEGVIADFRAPNILRVGFSPMILSFTDIALAVKKLIAVIQSRSFLEEKFQEKQNVT